MPPVVWTDNALSCVSRWHAFLKEKNPEAAKKAVKAIREDVDNLAFSPNAGKPVEYLDAQFRAYNVRFGKRGYVVLYRHEGDAVFVISVKHYLEIEFIV